MKNFIKGLILLFIYITGVLLGLGIVIVCEGGELDLKGEYYEKNGCIYLRGNLTEQEREQNILLYKERLDKREQQIDFDRELEHDIKIEEIKAKALENFLVAQSLDYNKIAEAIASRGDIVNSTWIGDISSSSNSKVGNVTSNSKIGNISTTNKSTNTLTNSATYRNNLADNYTIK